MNKKHLGLFNGLNPMLNRKIEMIVNSPFAKHQQTAMEAAQKAFLPLDALKNAQKTLIPFENYHKRLLDSVHESLKLPSPMAEIIEANNKSLELLKNSYSMNSVQLEVENIHKSWKDILPNTQSMIDKIQAMTSLNLVSTVKNLTLSESILNSNNLQEITGISSEILKSLKDQENKMASSIKALVESCKLPSDYLTLPISSINGASREIITSSYATSTLFPIVKEETQNDILQETERVKEETSECKSLILLIDPNLVQLYDGSINALESSSTDKSRHVFVSLRELCTHILHKLAPNPEVLSWIDPQDESLLYNDKPTRKARALYISRNINKGELQKFVQNDTSSIISLFDVFHNIHKIQLKLTDKQLRALVMRTESYIVYMINLWQETKSL